jgi:hypothetical protein
MFTVWLNRNKLRLCLFFFLGSVGVSCTDNGSVTYEPVEPAIMGSVEPFGRSATHEPQDIVVTYEPASKNSK